MNRITKCFQETKPFIGYLTVGDGGLTFSIKCANKMLEGGIDILELGIPFSDPIADGPVIQRAMQRALIQKVTPYDVLDVAAEIRKKVSSPLILFSYYNPIYQLGFQYLQKAKEVGIDGILIVDLPIEEAEEHIKACKELNLDPIFLVTPSTTKLRMKQIQKYAKGFVYYVCQKGTTGMKEHLPKELPIKLKQVKQEIQLPIAAGFGISTLDAVKQVTQIADGFVVGSYFMHAIEEGYTSEEIKQLTQKLSIKDVLNVTRT